MQLMFEHLKCLKENRIEALEINCLRNAVEWGESIESDMKRLGEGVEKKLMWVSQCIIAYWDGLVILKEWRMIDWQGVWIKNARALM